MPRARRQASRRLVASDIELGGGRLGEQLLGRLGHRLQAPHLRQRAPRRALVEGEEREVEVQAEDLELLRHHESRMSRDASARLGR